MALLTYLALASPRGFHRRDTLLALFWPESDNKRARHALRQAVHILRRAMGPGLIVGRGDNDLAIDRDALWCDAWEFQDALDRGDAERALSLYRGDLLPGFFASNAAVELDQWLGAERVRLKSLAATAAWSLAFCSAESGSLADRSRVIPLLARAARNASNAPERERLLIRLSWAQMSNDPSVPALRSNRALSSRDLFSD